MINFACRYYKGSLPCVFNKSDGSECPTCGHVSNFKDRILFIKLDAIGDVVRSASLLPSIISRHDKPYIAWLTKRDSAPLVRMMKYVDEVIELSETGVARIASGNWDHVYSLSNDMASASLATAAQCKRAPTGFFIQDGVIRPSNPAAEHWLELAAFDRLKQANTKSYQKLMLEILGDGKSEIVPPAFVLPQALQAASRARVDALFPRSRRKRLAVNVGAGGRWPKKMLSAESIAEFIVRLHKRADMDVMLVGGETEVEKANLIQKLCGNDPRVQRALTSDSLPDFVGMLSQANALLCGDTLALHIATALNLPTVSVFGPTSIAEIPEFGGLITKVAATQLTCLGCYGDCNKKDHCMSLISLDDLIGLVLSKLPALATAS